MNKQHVLRVLLENASKFEWRPELQGLRRGGNFFYVTDALILVKIHKRYLPTDPESQKVWSKIKTNRVLHNKSNVDFSFDTKELNKISNHIAISCYRGIEIAEGCYSFVVMRRLLRLLRALQIPYPKVKYTDNNCMRIEAGDHIKIIVMGVITSAPDYYKYLNTF